MKRLSILFLSGVCLLGFDCVYAQPGANNQAKAPVSVPVKAAAESKATRDAEAARILKERRANAQSLLISLAADAVKFGDQTLRARTQARIADALWDSDAERARTLFRNAWDAAEVADREGQQRLNEQIRQASEKTGGS